MLVLVQKRRSRSVSLSACLGCWCRHLSRVPAGGTASRHWMCSWSAPLVSSQQHDHWASVDRHWSCFPVGQHPSVQRSTSATNPFQVSSSSSPLQCMFIFLYRILLWNLFHTTHLVSGSSEVGAAKVYELLHDKIYCSVGWNTLFDCLFI
jgi:hypothetical protein